MFIQYIAYTFFLSFGIALMLLHVLLTLSGDDEKGNVGRLISDHARHTNTDNSFAMTEYSTLLLLLYAGKVKREIVRARLSRWTDQAPCSEEALLGSYLLMAWDHIKNRERAPNSGTEIDQ